MESPKVESAAVRTLSGLFQAAKLTRIQMGLAALALLALLYTALWIVLDRPSVVSAQEATPAVVTPVAEDAVDPSPVADDALSANFLGEYDRLAARTEPAETAADEQRVATPGSSLNTIFFSLLLVAGMAYAGIWGYKQVWLRKQGLPAALGGKRLSVQETLALGPNQRLHLVRLGDEVLLLGATEHTITCVARYGSEYVDETFADHLTAATTPKPASQAKSIPQPLSLQESLDSLRKVQHRPGGGDHA